MSRIFWDTNLLIYLFEGTGERAERVRNLRKRMIVRGDGLYTSALTLGEVLVKPLELGDERLCTLYEEGLAGAAVIVPFDREAARVYALIRRDRSIKAPDAIQLACAAHAKVDLFITNDDRLSNKVVPGVQFLTSLERAFL